MFDLDLVSVYRARFPSAEVGGKNQLCTEDSRHKSDFKVTSVANVRRCREWLWPIMAFKMSGIPDRFPGYYR